MESVGSNIAAAQRPRRRAELWNVIAISLPVVITTSSRALMDVTDFIIITMLHQPEAQAAILPAQTMVWSFIILCMGSVTAINTFAAQALGRQEPREASAYAWQIVYIGLGYGLIAIAMLPLLPGLIAAIGHEPAVQKLELAYAQVALMSTAPTIICNGLGWFFIGIHRPWITMWSAIESIIVNMFAAYLLVFGFWGIEPMGMAGAAWGTLIAVSYRSLWLLIAMLTPGMARRFGSRAAWQPSWSRAVRMLRVGAPVGFHFLCDVVVWAIFVNVLIGAHFGTADLIATNTSWQYMRVAFFPVIGVGQALTALVGKSIGSGDPHRAMRETRTACLLSIAYLGALSLAYWFAGDTLISWFNDDAEVIRIGASVMVCVAVFQLFDGIGIIYMAALRGAGDTFVPSLFFVAANWSIIVGGGWLVIWLWPRLGSQGPWIAASWLFILAAAFLWWRWRSGAWRKIDLFEGTQLARPTAESDTPVLSTETH